MKKQTIQNNSGITVCDSIVMSVKRKRVNLRQLESVLIALTGYVATIMVFLRMFHLKYNEPAFNFAAVVFAAVYIGISLLKKNSLWFILGTGAVGGVIAYRHMDSAAMGFKYVYNIIYRDSYHTQIDYYKFLKSDLEFESTTAFLILCLWILAMVIFIFTIHHPHPLPPLIVSFPILEIGMYNGLEVPIFWGILVVGFLIACFAMSTIDMGEYSGGSGGFVRKENLFFPKRQMRLKVTEKCGVYLILVIMTVAGITASVMKATNYKRSDELNRKRIEVRDAVNSFSMENLADSISDITSAFGLTIKVDSHKLGKISSMKYKDKTDMVANLSGRINGALYLKEYTGSVYRDNEWLTLPDSAYRADIFDDFRDHGVYPQDFPFRFNKIFDRFDPEYTISISSKLKGGRSFAPYGIDNIAALMYENDCQVTSRKNAQREFTYRFSIVDPAYIAGNLGYSSRNVYSLGSISDEEWRDDIITYCTEKGLMSYDNYLTIDTELPAAADLLYDNPALILTELFQEEYEKFVHENYLQVPDDTNMAEVYEEFQELIEAGQNADTAEKKLALLSAIRDSVSLHAQYSLDPGKTPNNRDFVNYFLLENHKGYCTHYATSGVILARMAGIPARYATGYVLVGDDFNAYTLNSDGSYTIEVKDNRSHAWVEVYLDGYGWVPFEFTAGYSDQSINTTPTTTAPPEEPTEEDTVTTAADRVSRPTSSRDRSRTTGSNDRGTEAAPTTVATTADGIGGGFGHGGGSKLKVPNAVKYIIYSILLAAAFVAAVILRRQLILGSRRRKFTEGASRRRIGHMYGYMERLLEYQGIVKSDMTCKDFAEDVEKRFGGNYFPSGSFAAFMDVSLRTVFSDGTPENSELEQCLRLTGTTAESIYAKASKAGKIYLRYVACLM